MYVHNMQIGDEKGQEWKGRQHCKLRHNTIQVYMGLRHSFSYLLLAVLGPQCCEGSLELRRAGAALGCSVWASLWGGLSCCRAQALSVWAR